MNLKMKLGSVCCSHLLLCSFIPANGIYHSILSKDDYLVQNVLVPFNIANKKTVTNLSNVLQEEVAHVSLNYEVVKLDKYTSILTDYTPAYVLLYEANIYVNNQVHYKGGMFNWFDGCHAGFLQSIDFSFKWNSVQNIIHSYCTPSVGDTNSNTELRILKDVNTFYTANGTDYYQQETSATYDKQTDGNCFTDDMILADIDFTGNTRDHIYSNSYHWEAANTQNLEQDFDSRLAAVLQYSKTIGSNYITFTQSFTYNNKITVIRENGHTLRTEVSTESSLYSGPCTNGVDDQWPLYFTFYGTSAIQTNSIPSSIDATMHLKTKHGSNVILDTFESEATTTFNISL